MPSQAIYTVRGMTCGHCVRAVTEEVSTLVGVQDVQVDLPTGTVTIISDLPLTDNEVRTAITEAGYEPA